jgi:DNA replication licensing factor MCM4
LQEQQTVSVAKAGIIATLNARTSILAAANPIHSKWNPKLPVVQNVNLPPSLLSRFDLVFLMLDKMDERHDTMLAKHLVALYMSDDEWSRRKLNNIVVWKFSLCKSQNHTFNY